MLAAGLLISLTLAFQNCSKVKVGHQSENVAENTSVAAPTENNGHAYDGKPKNCKRILDSGASKGNGLYSIWPDGTTQVQCFCDMTSDGGGWTLVINQPRARMFGMPIVSAVDANTHGKLDYPQISALLAGSLITTMNNIRIQVELGPDSYTNGLSPIPNPPEVFEVFLNSNGFSGTGAYWSQNNYPGNCTSDPGLQPASFSPVANYWYFGSGYGYGAAYSEGRNPLNAQNPFYRVPWTDLDGFYIDASGGGLHCQPRIGAGTRSIGLKGSVWIR
jgi:hypothetical protein